MNHLRTLAVLAVLATGAAAQTPADKDKEIQDLKKRVEALEKEKGSGGASDSGSTPTWKDLVSLGGHLKWYGFLRLDCHYTDSAFDNARFPTFVRAEENIPFLGGVSAPERNDDNFVASARLTRLGFDLDSGKIAMLGDASATGKLEIDFFSLPSSESRAVPRLRHAYGKVGWNWLYVLFGQTSDMASPLNPSLNPDNVLWNWGNTGDRRPQVRVVSEPTVGDKLKFFIGVMAGQEGAIRNVDTDALGVVDGDDSGWPKLEGRLAVSFQNWVEKKWITFGISGMTSEEQIDGAGVGGRHVFRTDMWAIDFEFPILEQLTFKMEYWRGRNLADIRGGSGQGVLANGQDIRASGGWAELKVAPVKWYAATLGYSRDNPHEHNLPFGARSENTVYYLMNTFTFDPFMVSLDVSHWRTEFVGLNAGRAWRYTLTLQLSF